MQFFEDIRVGDRFTVGRHTFMAAEIKSFAARFDPQPFHMDDSAAGQSHFGALCASGWHSAIVCIRLRVEQLRRESAEKLARGEPVAALGPSPGFRELKWLKPVYAGATVTYTSEVVELRPSNTRPNWGLVSFRNTGVDQTGEPVLSFISSIFVERRSAP
jgi:acyl dehydratase